MVEFRERGDRPVEAGPDGARAPDRFATERREIRALMDRAVRDPAFALSPEQEAGLRRAWAMSPNEASGYRPAYAQRLDLPGPDGRTTARDSLRAMPGLTPEAAEHHLTTANLTERPWLRPARDAAPESRRVIATVDQGEGHHLRRHEGAASGDVARARVEGLRDPANADAASRGRADDAFRVGADGTPRRHVCGAEATAIADPDAFATAVARATERPDVKAALVSPVHPTDWPSDIAIPIGDLLGPKGHEHCEGYRLVPVNGSLDEAKQNRAEWTKAQREGRSTDAVKPEARKIESFAGGTIVVAFRPRPDRAGHEIMTMYPTPPRA